MLICRRYTLTPLAWSTTPPQTQILPLNHAEQASGPLYNGCRKQHRCKVPAPKPPSNHGITTKLQKSISCAKIPQQAACCTPSLFLCFSLVHCQRNGTCCTAHLVHPQQTLLLKGAQKCPLAATAAMQLLPQFLPSLHYAGSCSVV